MEEPRAVIGGNLDQDDDVIDLAELAGNFFRIAKRIWWLFVLLVVAGIAGLYLFSYIRYSPLYRCEATFTISTGDNNSFYYSVSTADQMSRTFPYILDSSYFRSVLMDTLGTDALNGTISAETIENSNMVTMRVDSPSPEDARAILDAALAIYPEVSRFVLGDIEFQLIDEIQTPTSPYNEPSLRRILAYGGLGGLTLATLIVGLMALFNNTIKTSEDMERLSHLECLGALPEVHQKARKSSAVSRYFSALDPRSTHGFRESVHALEVRVRAAMEESGAKTILVTSSVAGEGKSTVAINLAEQLAQGGKRVLLVDLDLRRQQIAKMLGCKESISVPEVLRDPKAQAEGYIPLLERQGFYFWGGHTMVSRPAEVLSNRTLRQMLHILRDQLDYIVLDTPPCGLFPDAAMISDCADTALFVVRYDTVTKGEISEALSMLDSRQIGVLGYVFNAYPQTSSHYGYGRYGYGKYGYSGYGAKYGRAAETAAVPESAVD
ncbi:MAG TPA: P-loop NTPase [Candidatus Onthomonas avicola]|nr:P-loop NTPase [Candidatus Onthomonas avicola]